MLTGQLITAARKAKGMTMGDLARAVGCDRSGITHWEIGRRMPLPRWMDRLAAALDTTREALTGPDYRVSKHHATKRSATMAPVTSLSDDQLEAPEFINASAVVALLRRRFGKSINVSRLPEFVKQRGLPAYTNPLRLNRAGEPTLLFRESEVDAWLDQQIQRVRPFTTEQD